MQDGEYVFSASDPAATILIDAQPATGPLHLTDDAHAILIEREHREETRPLVLRWARNGEGVRDVPGWALRPRKVRGVRLTIDAVLSNALAASEWIWVGLLMMLAGIAIASGLSRIRRALAAATDWRTLRWILGASLMLNLIGIGWGLPGTWVAIELKPQYIFDALAQRFSHGWFDAYPPVHFYVLSLAWSPLLLLEYLHRMTFDTAWAYTLLVLISRLVSVAMAAAIVAAACVCGTRAFGRRAGLFAAAIVATMTPFLYYAKTANVDVPYMFWWALSMICYLRMLDRGRTRDFVLFATFGMLAICTKDQAYGLFLLTPLVVVEQLWREHRSIIGALTDRRLIATAVTSVAVFLLANNVILNFTGFMEHVRYITGPGAANYRVYDPTLAGHLALLRTSVWLTQISMGWPLFAISVAGLVLAVATSGRRRTAVWLMVPAISYYVSFINVILYNYDRFMMPVAFLLALFGGVAFDALLRRSARPGAALAAGAFAYTLLYAGTVDVLMVQDSRYEAERWMQEHIKPRDLVAVAGLHEYLPRIEDYHVEEIATVPELAQEHPLFVIHNADYGHAVPPDTEWGKMIAGLEHETLGYRRARVFRRPSPWPWLPGAHPDLVGRRDETVVFSTLRNINPTIEIYERSLP